MNVRVSIAIAAISVLMLASCGGGGGNGTTTQSKPTAGLTPAAGQGRGSVSAKIDGSAWAGTVTDARYANGTLTIAGADTSNPPRAIGFAVSTKGPGTYTIGPQDVSGANAVLTIGAAVWQAAPLVRGSGAITITSLTSTGASGTFSFTGDAVPQSTATGSKVISGGVFSVTFAAPVSLPATTTQTAAAAAITAQINGEAWSSSAQQRASLQNEFLSITGFDLKWSIQFGIGQVSGPGTHSLDVSTSNGSSVIVSSSSGQGYGTAFAGGKGSVTISTLTSTRVIGTFSFDAVPATGGASGTLHVTNGKFDIALQ